MSDPSTRQGRPRTPLAAATRCLAKVGLFAVVDRANEVGSSNYVDIESIRFYEPLETHSNPAKEKITP